tara:strand:+ start:376 stop:1959 length:1584 start_codon:yes stop_codon:yes gene_type:complete
MTVNVINRTTTHGIEIVWTGSEDGCLKAWPARVPSPEDLIDVSRMSGWVEVRLASSGRMGRDKYKRRWMTLDAGIIQFFKERAFGQEEDRLSLIDDVIGVVGGVGHGTSGEEFELQTRGRPSVAIRCEKRELWLGVLSRLMHAIRAINLKQSRFLSPLAATQLTGVTCIADVNGRIWVGTRDGAIIEFELTKPSEATGLRTYAFEVSLLRQMSAPVGFAALRMNVMLSISHERVWITYCNHIFVVSSSMSDFQHQTVSGREIITAAVVRFAVDGEQYRRVKVKGPDKPNSERCRGVEVRQDINVWVGDVDGSIRVWWCERHTGAPILRKVLSSNVNAAVSVIAPISESREVWIGYSSGDIQRWTDDGQLIGLLKNETSRSAEQGLPVRKGSIISSPTSVHGNVVVGLCESGRQVWSGGWDEQLNLWGEKGHSHQLDITDAVDFARVAKSVDRIAAGWNAVESLNAEELSELVSSLHLAPVRLANREEILAFLRKLVEKRMMRLSDICAKANFSPTLVDMVMEDERFV